MSQSKWQKSSFSGGGGNNCVELAATGGLIAIRESTDPERILTGTPGALGVLLRAVKAGEFDRLTI